MNFIARLQSELAMLARGAPRSSLVVGDAWTAAHREHCCAIELSG
jgi:hypothetical protein